MFNFRGLRRILPACGTFVCLMVYLAACSQPPTYPPPYPPATDARPASTEVIIKVQIDYVISTDTYNELIEKAEIIVTGTAVDTGLSFNASRRVETEFDLAKIYEFRVDRYLKGDGADTIFIVKILGLAIGVTAEQVREKVAGGDLIERQSPLKPDTPYLIFLMEHDYSAYPEVPKGIYYIGSSLPWLFDISDTQSIRMVDGWYTNPDVDFEIPLAQVIEYIQNPELIPPAPTPHLLPTASGRYPAP